MGSLLSESRYLLTACLGVMCWSVRGSRDNSAIVLGAALAQWADR